VDTSTVDVYLVVDVFLLLLIGVGPKIALVPFLEVTDGMDTATRARVTRKMLTTAAVVSLLLVTFGELLRRLLHFSTGALSVAGGIILFIIAVTMIRGPGDAPDDHHGAARDPMQLAVFPLAVPYLLNPAGIVVLVTLSADADSVSLFLTVVGTLAAVLAIDVLVFRAANRVSEHLDASRMLITEKVFGFLLAALGVQLALNGLADAGVISLTGH
jgi:MarC family membrane protein